MGFNLAFKGLMKFEFLRQMTKYTQISNFIKIRPMGAELHHADRQGNRRTGMTKLVVAFRNFAQAHNEH